MLGSFYNGLSGLRSNTEGLSVVSNNLANVNSIGFKRSRAEFAELVNTFSGRSDNGSPFQVGLGSVNTQITALFNQGSIINGQAGTNLALAGEGFFQVREENATRYTRAGNFSFQNQEDGTVTLVNARGATVQGYLGTDENGLADTSGGIEDLTFDFSEEVPGRATTQIGFKSNLPAGAAAGSSFQDEVTVYAADGTEVPLRVTYTKGSGNSDWSYSFLSYGNSLTVEGSGSLSFDSQGKLASVNGAAIPATGTVSASVSISGLPGGASQTLSWQLAGSNATGDEFSSRLTSYGASFSSATPNQDGIPPAMLEQVEFAQDGTIVGIYSNGVNRQLGRVAVAVFHNTSGLVQTDGGMFRATSQSGAAAFSTTNEDRASVLGGSLESSNVDVAEEFTDMILHQRGYQSSSKAITTSDQIMQEILGLKR